MIKATAVILAGGASKRMNGQDKAYAIYNGKPLIEHALNSVKNFSEVIITSSRYNYESHVDWLHTSEYDHVNVIVDHEGEKGPVGGIYTGIRHAQYKNVVVVSVDTPLVNINFFKYLLNELNGYDVVVPKSEGVLQPLCAVYSKSIESVFNTALEKGHLKIIRLLEELRVKEVDEEIWLKQGFKKNMFLNINTYENLRQLNETT